MRMARINCPYNALCQSSLIHSKISRVKKHLWD
eukprot:Gb_08410 [translate_table: standard]